MKKLMISLALLLTFLLLAACSVDSETNDGHSHMILDGSGDVPEGLQLMENPTYPVGSFATSKATHMDGMMMDVKVKIVEAFETTAYVTSYAPADHPRVENHKWIVQEEFVGAGDEALVPDTEVKTTANHMMGMKEAVHEIVSSEETTVYMVDYTTPDGQKVTNHKWVTKEELEPLS